MTDVVIPIKNLSQAKSRLGSILSQPERAELVLAMLTDLLNTVTKLDQGRIWVVASDDEVFDIARQFDAGLVLENFVLGYNAAISLGFKAMPDTKNLAVIPADVPLATQLEVSALVQPTAGDKPVIRLAPDHGYLGTNGLFLSSGNLMCPGFGTGSFNRHCARAQNAGIKPTILNAPYLAHDIDTPDDLEGFAGICSQGSTFNFLCTIGVHSAKQVSSMEST